MKKTPFAAACLALVTLSSAAFAQTPGTVGGAINATTGVNATTGTALPGKAGGTVSGQGSVGIGAGVNADAGNKGSLTDQVKAAGHGTVHGAAEAAKTGATAVNDGKPQIDTDASARARLKAEIEEEKVKGAANSKAQGKAIGVANAKARQNANVNSAAGTNSTAADSGAAGQTR